MEVLSIHKNADTYTDVQYVYANILVHIQSHRETE